LDARVLSLSTLSGAGLVALQSRASVASRPPPPLRRVCASAMALRSALRSRP